jgi:hypothetical protein
LDILDCACLLSRDGYAQLLYELDAKINSLRKIAASIGVTRRTLYKYYRNETADIKESHKRRLLELALIHNRAATLRLLRTRLDALRAVLEIALRDPGGKGKKG